MTLAEFKAWFEGFTEDMDGSPNARQWKRIQQRVKAIDGVAVDPVVIREYWPRRYWETIPYWGSYSETLSATCTNRAAASQPYQGAVGAGMPSFNSAVAMTALGKADALSLEGVRA